MTCEGDVCIVKAQNAKLEQQIQKLNERNSTDFQKSYYENQTTDTYTFANSLLFWIYYLVVALVTILLFRNPVINMKLKAVIVGSFIAYPFIINTLERFLYKILAYAYALVSGTVYVPPSV
jgi:hypothetical protein